MLNGPLLAFLKDVLVDTRLQASVEIQCGIDLCMMDGYNFSSITLTLFTETSPLRTSATLWNHMWATMDQRYVQVSFQFQFALIFNKFWSVNEILAFTQNIFCVDIHDAKKRLWAEILALQSTYGYFTSSSIHLQEERFSKWMQRCLVE